MVSSSGEGSGPALREVQVTFDCADPRALSAFWCEVLGYRVDPPPLGFETWDAALVAWGVPEESRNDASACSPPEGGGGPRLFFQKVPEGKIAKNRVHLDVRAAPGLDGADRMAALDAEAARLEALGAQVVQRVGPGDQSGPMAATFVVMHDPEGNEFCLD